MMSTLVQTRCQVWLTQTPLTETCRKVLRAVPVEQGELFGSAALEALERAAQTRQTRQKLSGFTGVCPLLASLRAPQLSPSGAHSQLITLVAY